MEMPGEKFLKITGIIYIVFGGINIILSLILIVVVNSFSSILNAAGFSFLDELGFSFTNEVVGFSLNYLISLGIFGGLFGIFVGIMGVKDCKTPTLKKAQFLIYLAVSDLAITTYDMVVMGNWLSLLFFALPILYLIGAVKNKKMLLDVNIQKIKNLGQT